MGGKLLGNLCSSGKLDKFEVPIAMASINEFPSRSIDFLLAYTQSDLDVDILLGLPLVMGVDLNIV